MTLKLKSSARIKRRYILVEAKNKEEVERAVLDYIGILGWARAGAVFVKTPGGKIVLAVERGEVDNVRAALELSEEKIKVIKVSGTLAGIGKEKL